MTAVLVRVSSDASPVGGNWDHDSHVATRADALRTAVEARYAALMETLQPLTESQWRTMCPAEGWPVGYVAHHIGQGFIRQAGWITQVLAGEEPFEFNWAVTHELNARRRERLGLPTKSETLAYLHVATSHFCELIGSLSDAQLDLVGFTQVGRRRSIEWVANVAIVRHVDEHHDAIRAAVLRG